MSAQHPKAIHVPALYSAARPTCQDELTLVTPDGKEAIGISLWDNKQNAETYQRETYPEIQKILTKSIEGTPQVKTYEVPYSTLTKAARGGAGA